MARAEGVVEGEVTDLVRWAELDRLGRDARREEGAAGHQTEVGGQIAASTAAMAHHPVEIPDRDALHPPADDAKLGLNDRAVGPPNRDLRFGAGPLFR